MTENLAKELREKSAEMHREAVSSGRPLDPFAETLLRAADELDRHAALDVPAGERKPEWRCFHCDEVFTDPKEAALHFGCMLDDHAACKRLNDDDRALLKTIADLSARWTRCLNEDCDASRVYHSMSADMARKVREAEEAGYAKGLADGRTPPAVTEAMVEAAQSAYAAEISKWGLNYDGAGTHTVFRVNDDKPEHYSVEDCWRARAFISEEFNSGTGYYALPNSNGETRSGPQLLKYKSEFAAMRAALQAGGMVLVPVETWQALGHAYSTLMACRDLQQITDQKLESDHGRLLDAITASLAPILAARPQGGK